MKLLIPLLLLLSSCCLRPTFMVSQYNDRPHAYRIGCETVHRCHWVAQRLCGAAGYSIDEKTYLRTETAVEPFGFTIDGRWETTLIVECKFPRRK